MGLKVLPPDVTERFKNFAMIQGGHKTSPQPSPYKGEGGGGIPSPYQGEGNLPATLSLARRAGGEVAEGAGFPPLTEGRTKVGSAGVEAHIRFGLNGIKNLGEHIAEVIYRERKNNGTYKNLEDFLRRIDDKDLNKKSLESLVKCGAMDSFGYDRGLLLANTENLLAFIKAVHVSSATTQNSLFSGTKIDLNQKVRLNPALDAAKTDKMNWEKELLGLYVTAHPYSPYEKIFHNIATSLNDLPHQPRGGWVVVGGVIASAKKKITRKGDAMMFVTIQYLSGSLELLVFPRTYEATKDVWVEGRIVCVMGKTSEEEGDDKLFVEKAYVLTEENAPMIAAQIGMSGSMRSVASQSDYVPSGTKKEEEPGVVITLAPDEVKKHADALKAILSAHTGDKPVYLAVRGKKIKTSYRVSPSDELTVEVDKLVGEGKVKY
jgi:DNA polymerase-3 subunit alpha